MDASWSTWGEILPTLAAIGAVCGSVVVWFRLSGRVVTQAVEHTSLAADKKVDDKLEELDVKLEKIDARFARVEERFEKIDAKFERVGEMIDAKFERLREEIRKDHAKLDARISAMERRLDTRVDRIETLLLSILSSTGALPAQINRKNASDSPATLTDRDLPATEKAPSGTQAVDQPGKRGQLADVS